MRTKIWENFVWIKENVRIIHISKSVEKHRTVQIIQDVQITQGQIVRAIL